MQGFLTAVNVRRRQVIEPGTFVVLDESMVQWLAGSARRSGRDDARH